MCLSITREQSAGAAAVQWAVVARSAPVAIRNVFTSPSFAIFAIVLCLYAPIAINHMTVPEIDCCYQCVDSTLALAHITTYASCQSVAH